MFAHLVIGRQALENNNTEKALEIFRKGQILPQSLGAGIWNHCKLVPLKYFEALSLEKLGNKAGADEIFRYIATIGIEYFSNMHLKELPYYQACAWQHLGEEITKENSFIDKAEKADMGYCFPSSADDIAVLEYAIENGKNAANANYYLGCLYYDRSRYDEAAECFESCVRINPEHGSAWRNLSLYMFDKKHDCKKALCCMENALKYRSHDPRLLLEYEQLLKNTNSSIEERLAVYDKYPELLKERDDCYLDKLTLLSQQGKYEEAINMAAVKHFHIYEGGEGKLTKQHAWMHVLYGNELANNGDTEKAEQIYINGINMPKSYGEAKTFFNQEAHIYYYLSKLYTGDKRTEALEKAAEYKAAVSEISLFRALALKELGREDEAKQVLDEMLSTAQSLIDNKDMRTYYGVGSPSPMPFELDIEKHNLLAGYTLKAFALYGEEKYSEAEICIRKAEKLDLNDFAVYAYKQITE